VAAVYKLLQRFTLRECITARISRPAQAGYNAAETESWQLCFTSFGQSTRLQWKDCGDSRAEIRGSRAALTQGRKSAQVLLMDSETLELMELQPGIIREKHHDAGNNVNGLIAASASRRRMRNWKSSRVYSCDLLEKSGPTATRAAGKTRNAMRVIATGMIRQGRRHPETFVTRLVIRRSGFRRKLGASGGILSSSVLFLARSTGYRDDPIESVLLLILARIMSVVRMRGKTGAQEIGGSAEPLSGPGLVHCVDHFRKTSVRPRSLRIVGSLP